MLSGSCSENSAQIETSTVEAAIHDYEESNEFDQLHEATFSYRAPELYKRARRLPAFQNPRFQESIQELVVQRDAASALVRPIFNQHCLNNPQFTKLLPFVTCVVTEESLRTLRRRPDLILVGTKTGENEVAQFSHSPQDEETSWSFQNMDNQGALSASTGQGIKIGLVEFSACGDGKPLGLDPTVEALAAVTDVHLLNPTNWQPGMSPQIPHMHSVLTAMTHYNAASEARDILPEAEFFVANVGPAGWIHTCDSGIQRGLPSALEWFVANGVRLINRSTFSLGSGANQCDEPDYGEERVLDEYARVFDLVVTSAAGQTTDSQKAVCGVMCDAMNQTCVGGASDTDDGNVGTSADLVDDEWISPVYRDLKDIFFYFEDPEEQDREEPDLVAPAIDLVASYIDDQPGGDLMMFVHGTSGAAPLVLALAAKQLEMVTGPAHWTECRVSEFMRAALKFGAGAHPVLVDGVPRRSAPHDLMVSGNNSGAPQNARCLIPEECETGLTCLVGVCAQPPGDEKVGWGMATPLEEIMNGEWGCAGTDPNTGERCGLSKDGSCPTGISPSDAVPFDTSIPTYPPPNANSVADGGYPLFEGFFSEGETYRGVVSWSSCPVQPQYGEDPCSTDDDCPINHFCNGFLRCETDRYEERRKIPAVQFNVKIANHAAGEDVWLSYSRDDATEAFEFVFPDTGYYQGWLVGDKNDWVPCDSAHFEHLNTTPLFDKEWPIFFGGIVPPGVAP